MQCPNVVRVPRAPLDRIAQPQVVAVDLLGLGDMPLIEEKGGQRMPRGMHPGPRLGVGQVVIKLDGATKVPIRLFVTALVIGKLSVEQGGPHGERCMGGIAQEAPAGRDALQLRVKQLALPVRGGEITHRRIGHALGIVLHRGSEDVKSGVVAGARGNSK